MTAPKDDDNSRVPTLTEVITKGVNARLGDVHTVLVAEVLSYDDSNGTVDVQPYHKQRFNDGTFEKFPVLAGIPVIQHQYGDFTVRSRPKVGQEVTVLVHERSLDEWLVTSNKNLEPVDPRRFDLSDGLVIPGPSRLSEHTSVEGAGELYIGKDDGSIRIIIDDGGKIQIGTSGVDLLGLVDQLIAALQSAVVATVLGPQPLDPATQTLLTNIKAQLALIKGA